MNISDNVITYSGHKAEVVWCDDNIKLAQIVFKDLTRKLVKYRDIKILNCGKSSDGMLRE